MSLDRYFWPVVGLRVEVVTDGESLGHAVGCVADRLFTRAMTTSLCGKGPSRRSMSNVLSSVMVIGDSFVGHISRPRPNVGPNACCRGLVRSFGGRIDRVVSRVSGVKWTPRGKRRRPLCLCGV